MSMPMADTDGLDHSRAPTGPDPVRRTSASRSALGAEVLGSDVRAVPDEAGDPLDGDVAFLVVEGREQPGQCHHGVGSGPAELSRMERVLEGAHRDHADDLAPEGGRQGGRAGPQVAHVADDEQVAGEQLGVGLDERLKVAVGLLHPLQDQLQRAGWLAVEEPQHAQMDDQAALVVRGAAPVDATVVLAGGRPGVAGPALLGRGRLDVVVGIEHDGRGAVGTRDLAVHGRIAGRDLLELRAGESGLPEQPERLIGHLPDGFGRVAGEGHRWDGHQALQIGQELGHQACRSASDLVRSHASSAAAPSTTIVSAASMASSGQIQRT
jgi:hypothetical protein